MPSRNIAKVFSRVLVRKCGNFLIPRMTKMQSARVQIMLERPILRVDTPYPAECGVSVVCLGPGLPQPSYGTMILIFTNKEDAHPNPVIDILTERGVPFFRLNTEALGFLRIWMKFPRSGVSSTTGMPLPKWFRAKWRSIAVSRFRILFPPTGKRSSDPGSLFREVAVFVLLGLEAVEGTSVLL